MHLDLRMEQNFQNLQVISTDKQIFSEELTKDRLIDVFMAVLVNGFVMSQFDPVAIPGTKFDPYRVD